MLASAESPQGPLIPFDKQSWLGKALSSFLSTRTPLRWRHATEKSKSHGVVHVVRRRRRHSGVGIPHAPGPNRPAQSYVVGIPTAFSKLGAVVSVIRLLVLVPMKLNDNDP